MNCTSCGSDLHENGIDEAITVFAYAYAFWNGEKFQWDGTTEYGDEERHVHYACPVCGVALTPEQQTAIVVG